MSRAIALLLVTVLLLASTGCSSVGTAEAPDAAEEAEPVTAQAPIATAPADFSYLDGTWHVTVALTDLDEESLRDALTGDEQSWTLSLDGAQLQLDTGKVTYSGTLEPVLDDEWDYAATATLTDEDGAAWRNAIELHGRGTAEDEFVGEMTLQVESPPGTHQYEATWDITAKRQ